MKKFFAPVLLLGVLFISCSEDEITEETVNEIEAQNLEVEQFIYRAMSDWYLYVADVQKLQEGFFPSPQEKEDYLASFDSPENLYDDLQASHDRFSFMWDNYEELENMLYSGIEKTEGLNWAWGTLEDNHTAFVAVRYVLPNTPAAEAGIKRGDVFLEVNGTQLTRNNLGELMSLDSYTVSFAEYKDGKFQLTGKTADLTQIEMAENPVHTAKIVEIEGKKIAYLLYNGFTLDFDAQLNAAFGEFKNANVDELVLDLRYNSGGSIETAVDLSSMITGQFENKVMAQTMLNEKWQTIYDAEAPEVLKYRFNNQIRTKEAINSLNLTKVYVIATRSSASASELVINGLDAYIDVVHIGSKTAGKYQGSRTLYDSPTSIFFSKENVNPNHTYALQPLISKVANANGKSDYGDGLNPDIEAREYVSTYGELGNPEEGLFKIAIDAIFGNAQAETSAEAKKMEEMIHLRGESGMSRPTYQRMYETRLPSLQ
jgi:carboxyl-terminal processing protease